MHGIERADRFDGKGAADASEHGSVNIEDEAAPLEGSQGSNGRLFFFCRQPTGRARARMIARPASAKVRADVTCCVPAGGGFMAAVSCSNSAATSALDSMYHTFAPAALGRRARVADFRVGRRRGALRFATIAVDQFSGGARRQPDVRPVLERVTGFHWRVENAGGCRHDEGAPRTLPPRGELRQGEHLGKEPGVTHANPSNLDPAYVSKP